jgi:hypothetical protein
MADIACGICGALTDERTISFVSDLVDEELAKEMVICQGCLGYYTDEQLIEKVENL